jgi:hypothetical protein
MFRKMIAGFGTVAPVMALVLSGAMAPTPASAQAAPTSSPRR